MAKTSDIEIIWEKPSDARNYIQIPVATASTLAPGDLVKITAYATNTCSALAAGTTAELFAGISTGYYTAGQNATICTNCIANITNTSTAIEHAGMTVKYVSGDNGTAWVVGKTTDVLDAIAWSMEAVSASAVGKFWVAPNEMRQINVTTNHFTSAKALGLFRLGSTA